MARRWRALAALCAAAAGIAHAAPPAEQAPRFEIRRFVFDGATLVPRERLQAATAPFTGPARDFGDVQRALEAVVRVYGDAGYSAVQVLLPEQEPKRGEIRLRIVEARLGRVVVEGNRYFDDANVRASVPALVPGIAPNILQIGRNLRLANENPSKQATALLRGGREEGLVDAVVRVIDEPPARRSLTLDSSGTRETGRARLGLGYRNANVAGGDQVLTLQAVGAPHEVLILGAGLRVPLYGSGDSLEAIAGYSSVDSGMAGELFQVSGAGEFFGVRYARNLDRHGDYDQRLVLAWDHRSYRVGDVTVRPLSLTYSGRLRRQGSETAFSLGASRNADPEYMLWRWSIDHDVALPGDWQLRAGLNGQFTRDTLVPGEQFGLGGADSVRGFEERALHDDRGYRGTLEVYTPDLGARTGWPGTRLRALAFYDWGGLRRNRPAPGDPAEQGIASVGIGLRLTRGANLSLRMDWGWVVDAGGAPGDGRLHASLSCVF